MTHAAHPSSHFLNSLILAYRRIKCVPYKETGCDLAEQVKLAQRLLHKDTVMQNTRNYSQVLFALLHWLGRLVHRGNRTIRH